jgi:hypothetical protein
MTPLDPEGQVSLMIVREHLAYPLRKGVISNGKALEAFDGVLELARENESGQRPSDTGNPISA